MIFCFILTLYYMSISESISKSKSDYDNTIQKLISQYGIAQSAYISNLDKNDITQSNIYLKQMTDINSNMSLFANKYSGMIGNDSVYTATPKYISNKEITNEVNYYINGVKKLKEKNTEIDAINESLDLERNMFSMYSIGYLIIITILVFLFFSRINSGSVDTLETFILYLSIIILLFYNRDVLYKFKPKTDAFIKKNFLRFKSNLYSNNY